MLYDLKHTTNNNLGRRDLTEAHADVVHIGAPRGGAFATSWRPWRT
jgi:hypothetical protein